MNGNSPLQFTPVSPSNGMVPCKGPRAVPVLINFALGSLYSLDLSIVQSQGYIECVQTVFVDNSANPNALKISTSPSINQTIVCPANSQGYFPILQTNPPQMQFSTAYGGEIMVQLLNFYVAPHSWPVGSGNGTSNYDANGNLKTADQNLATAIANGQVIVQTQPEVPALLADRSGTITTGGTAQPAAPANTSRKLLIIGNPAAAVLNVAIGNTGHYIPVAAGTSLIFNANAIPSDAIWVEAAAGAQAFTMYEW